MADTTIPCPFCGNSESLSPVWEGPFDWADGIWTGQMHCEKCGARGPIVHFMEQYEVDVKTSVAWNERHESNELPEWLINKIVDSRHELERHIGSEFVKNTFERGKDAALKWVLSRRRDEND